ncbi:MAG: SinI family restriction endonuclease [Parvibaculales bacterium]
MHRDDCTELILDFLSEHPAQFSSRKKNNRADPKTPEGKAAIREIINAARERKPKPAIPKTIPDPVVGLILQEFYSVKKSEIERVETEHKYAMAAENIIGELLERYIEKKSEEAQADWCRAHGDVIKSVDFLRRKNGSWEVLQIKNRDNSENSSSSSVRDGTDIKKWFRTFSKTGKTNWANFPDDELKNRLNESDFRDYVRDYLREIKA